MHPIKRHVETLKKFFERKRVALLSELREVTGARSRTTVFLSLKAVGYLSSYNHAGRYYALRRNAKFDEHGLWFVGEVRFSKYGTLRATIVVLVREAPAGRTHEELEAILGLRVHDTLRSLVEERELAREQLHSLYVYLDTDPQRAAAQLEERRRKGVARPQEPAHEVRSALDPQSVIEILVAVIHAPREDARATAARLRARGLGVSDKQVEAVFEQYGLGKKTARSRSPHSRR